MKCIAYICDYKNHLVHEDVTIGITPVEDIFDKQSSFPTCFKPEKADIHYCTECYNEHVLIPARTLSDRAKDERGYELKVKELAYALRCTTVANYHKKMETKRNRGNKSGPKKVKK